MRIYTNIANRNVLYVLARDLGIYVDIKAETNSRKRAKCYNVLLSSDAGTGRRRANSGRYGGATKGATGDYAATWDEWGTFLARIFDLDPTAICGQYDGADDFAWQTGDSYGDGTDIVRRCVVHRWHMTVPREQACINNCGAVRRWRFAAA